MEALDGPFPVLILINFIHFYRKYSTDSNL